MQDNERWLSDGDCSKCRRSKYCSTVCSAHKQKHIADLHAIVGRAMFDAYSRGVRSRRNDER